MVKETKTLLDGVETTGASTIYIDAAENLSDFTFYIKRAGTVDCTVAIEARDPFGDWTAIHSQAYTTAGTEAVTFSGAFDRLRANVTARNNGTISVACDAG